MLYDQRKSKEGFSPTVSVLVMNNSEVLLNLLVYPHCLIHKEWFTLYIRDFCWCLKRCLEVHTKNHSQDKAGTRERIQRVLVSAVSVVLKEDSRVRAFCKKGFRTSNSMSNFTDILTRFDFFFLHSSRSGRTTYYGPWRARTSISSPWI